LFVSQILTLWPVIYLSIDRLRRRPDPVAVRPRRNSLELKLRG
jgi:hypothetical protein